MFYFIYITIVKITGDGFKSFDEGQRVQFDILKGQRGSQAENVSKI
ncbi:cold shock domain-containing protein [Peribacillus sp. YIM B13472]|uniref:Cold shock domain-containing protein n=1 Tax=Neobacillus pocheonensis TaxID=363869 RepID=A0ABT0WDM4_9BACI|nr:MULTISPECIES: cold shock domain-containing protein [Bacillaceae]MCM2534411.1 cold shock domain-containing protein [Neobacillus pocheonensis]MED4691869.1 cold shock domain-containing protein [Peribacillus frigoritolerans]WHX93751.1 cold shock domain-containing protein [Peribacillus simplex]